MTQASKINLLGLSHSQLTDFFQSIGESAFRARQVLKWIHQMGVDDFDSMTNLSKSLRVRLAHLAEISAPRLLQHCKSTDGTIKFLFQISSFVRKPQLEQGPQLEPTKISDSESTNSEPVYSNAIEAVFIPDGDRGTLCISSQVGCALDCSFCATGKQGFNRDLSAAEIIGQVWHAAHYLGQFNHATARPITNVVFMGMGEPLLNFDNVMTSLNVIMDDNAYGLSKRRVTISTAGVVPALDRLADHTEASLAISLHAPNNALRNTLVPLNRKYPIESLLSSAANYIRSLSDSRRKITIEYTLIDQVNDRIEHAEELAALLLNLPVKINLIPFNPFDLVDYRRVSNNALRRFQNKLIEAGYVTTVRTTRGDDIEAACGQLAGSVNDRTRRQQHYQRQLQSRSAAVEPIKFMSNG